MSRTPARRERRRSGARGLEGAMGNFEKLSVLVIVVIIVMILVVALYQWTGEPGSEAPGGTDVAANEGPAMGATTNP